MTTHELADRLDAMALIGELPVTCPMPCCQNVGLRAHTWPDSCRAELRQAARILRTIRET